MVHTLKIIWTNEREEVEIRRMTVCDNVLNQYDMLVENIAKLFPNLSGKSYLLKWKDSEGDYIVMSSDAELSQAVANAIENGLIKLYITTQTEVKTDHGKQSSSIPHPHVVCDACDRSVIGYRFKCLECADYDLCNSCHAMDKHPGHDMLKIVKPVGHDHSWMFPGWRRMYRSMFGRHPVGRRFGGRGKFSQPPQEGETEEKAKGETSNGEPPNPNSPKSPHSEFLKNIGKSVAYFLDPLGIDVDVRVSDEEDNIPQFFHKSWIKMPEGKPEPQKNAAAASPASEAIPEEKAASSTPQAQKEDTAVDSTAQGARPKCAGLFGVPEDVAIPTKDDKNDCKCSSSSEALAGWTVVNDVPIEIEEQSSVPQQAVDTEVKVVYPVLDDKLPFGFSTPTEEVHKDPKISNALAKMCAMGFTNEGGWLLKLLETKTGNINEVLDAMYPNRH